LKLRGGGLQVFKLWGSNCKITDTSWVKSEFSPKDYKYTIKFIDIFEKTFVKILSKRVNKS
jgi:hypothetical protein